MLPVWQRCARTAPTVPAWQDIAVAGDSNFTVAELLHAKIDGLPIRQPVIRIQPMKLVVAVIKPFRFEACLRALKDLPVHELAYNEARGYGRQKDHLQDYRNDRFAVAFLPKMRLEFQVEAEYLKSAIDAICSACRSGRQGDGKIWVLDGRVALPQAVRP